MKPERDPVSNLFKRAYAFAKLEQLLADAKTTGDIGVIILTDFDRYKRFNDSYGHDNGDILLQAISETVLEIVGDKGIASRAGGDEFLIILPSASPDEALSVAERIRSQTEQLKVDIVGQLVASVTMTLGLAFYPQHGDDMNTLLRAADEAVWYGKEAKGNRVCVAKQGAT